MKTMDRQELLLKALWTYHDIADYIGCKTTKAIELKKIAITKFGGGNRYLPNMVARNAVLEMFGTTFENEIKAIRKEDK